MRQVSPATNLLLTCLTAVALALSMQLPWFAPPLTEVTEFDGPVERAAMTIARIFEPVGGEISGQDAFGETRAALFAAIVVTLCGLMAVPALRDWVRDPLRGVSVLAPLAVGYAVIVRPEGAEGDIHWGSLVACGLSVFLVSAAWQGSALRARRRPTPNAGARSRA